MAEYHVSATGTAPGSGTAGNPWVGFSNVPNGVIGPLDTLWVRGTFTTTSGLGLPGFAAGVTATNRVTLRYDYPGEPGVIQCSGTGFLNVNRSCVNFLGITAIGANGMAVYINGNGRNNVTFENALFQGTVATAGSVVRIEDGAGIAISDITFKNSAITGTARYGLQWLVFGTVTSAPATLTNLTLDGFDIHDFVSDRAALELRIDPGSHPSCKLENLIMRNCRAWNIGGVAWEISVFRRDRFPGFLMEDCEAWNITSVLPTGSSQRLGGGLGISGPGPLNTVQPIIRRTKIHDVVGVGGGVDTFWCNDVLMDDCDFWNIRSDDGDIDGSAVIADTGTRGLTIRNCRAWNIYGDRTAANGSYKGGAGLNILQAESVIVESFYMENVRIGVTFGIHQCPQLNPNVSVTVSGNIATVGAQYDWGEEMLVAGVKWVWGRFPTDQPQPAFAGTYTMVDAGSPLSTPGTSRITGAKTLEVMLATSPGAAPTAFGNCTPYAAQSSSIRGVTALGCTETGWWIGGLNDQMANHDMDGQGTNLFNVARPDVPLFVQFYPVVGAWTREKNNFYSGSLRQDPFNRHQLRTSTIARMGRNSKE